MVEAVVEFDYEGKEDDELSLKIGDVITNIDKQSGGWWEGVLNGKRGVFPDNFVKERKKEASTASPAAVKKPAGNTGHIAELANKLGNIKPGSSAQGPPNAIKRAEKSPVTNKRAKVTFAYSPQNEDELRLDVGDVVEVLKQEEEGWWQGSLNGTIGVFPSNFVEIIDASTPAEEADVAGTKADTHEIKGKKIKGIGLGNIFGNDGPRLPKTPDQAKEPLAAVRHDITPNHTETPPSVGPAENKIKKTTPQGHKPQTNVPTLPPKDKKLERARVLFSYSAENEDELSIEEGDIIVILEKDLEDSGWWKGELRGKQGVFPDNFVELLPPEEPAKPKKPPPPAAVVPVPVVHPVKQTTHEPKTEAKPEPPRMQPIKQPSDKAFQKQSFNKKPSMPPPVSKKPLPKPDEPVTDDQKAAHHGDPSSEGTLDTVESAQRLSHLNNNRPPGPSNRRVPTNPKSLAQDGSESEGKQEELTDEPPPLPPDRKKSRPKTLQPPLPPPPLSVVRDVKGTHDGPEKEETKVTPKRPTQPPEPQPATCPPRHSQPTTAPDAGAVTDHVTPSHAPSSAELEELRGAVKSLQENTVSRSQYEELQKELVAVKEEVSGIKEQLRKRTIELMTEVDDEKKVRLSMQVELDRLKRMVMS